MATREVDQVMSETAQLLKQIIVAFQADRIGHRDAQLQLGRDARRYIQLRVAESATNTLALKEVSAAVCVSENQVSIMIATAMAAAMLSDRDQLGGLPITALRHFCVFVERINPDGAEWAPKKQYVEKARELFRRVAVAIPPKTAAIQKEIRGIIREQPRKTGQGIKIQVQLREQAKESIGAVEQVKRSASAASPGDVAAMVWDIIAAAEDPAAVAIRLRVMLERWLPKKAKVTA
jgi:hypothetical protein